MDQIILTKLTEGLEPTSIEVETVDASSGKYAVKVVSPKFKGVALLDRHRMVNELLKEELAGPLHALTISAKPPPAE